MDNELPRFARLAAVARRVVPAPSRFATPAYAPAALDRCRKARGLAVRRVVRTRRPFGGALRAF
jgi:hypothetical protein